MNEQFSVRDLCTCLVVLWSQVVVSACQIGVVELFLPIQGLCNTDVAAVIMFNFTCYDYILTLSAKNKNNNVQEQNNKKKRVAPTIWLNHSYCRNPTYGNLVVFNDITHTHPLTSNPQPQPTQVFKGTRNHDLSQNNFGVKPLHQPLRMFNNITFYSGGRVFKFKSIYSPLKKKGIEKC